MGSARSTALRGIAKAAEAAGNVPCTTCLRRAACATQHLACRAFAAFTHRGSWRRHHRTRPTRQRYHRIFREEDV